MSFGNNSFLFLWFVWMLALTVCRDQHISLSTLHSCLKDIWRHMDTIHGIYVTPEYNHSPVFPIHVVKSTNPAKNRMSGQKRRKCKQIARSSGNPERSVSMCREGKLPYRTLHQPPEDQSPLRTDVTAADTTRMESFPLDSGDSSNPGSVISSLLICSSYVTATSRVVVFFSLLLFSTENVCNSQVSTLL